MAVNKITKLVRILAPVFLLALPILSNAQTCEGGHWIKEISRGGKLIKLGDGSLWQVSSIDVSTSNLWLPAGDITVCGNTMINTDDRESVAVTRISRPPARDFGPLPRRDRGHVIETAINDEKFIINGKTYVAKTFCFDFDEGDRVRFAEGSALEVCTSVEILHLESGKACKLWCE